MTDPAADRSYDAVLFALEDVLAPFHSVRAWQWAWRPQGPILSERRLRAAVRRSLKTWDQRRWQTLTGKAPPLDAAALEAHLAETLRALAGRSLPAAESDAVVRRMLHPAGEVERFPEAGPTLDRLRAGGVRLGVVSALPAESAGRLLQRAGFPSDLWVGAAEVPGPLLPAREAFEAAIARLGASTERTVWVGGLYWSDQRAGERLGLRSLLVDRFDAWPQVAGEPLASLDGLEARLAAPAPARPPDPEPERGA